MRPVRILFLVFAILSFIVCGIAIVLLGKINTAIQNPENYIETENPFAMIIGFLAVASTQYSILAIFTTIAAVTGLVGIVSLSFVFVIPETEKREKKEKKKSRKS